MVGGWPVMRGNASFTANICDGNSAREDKQQSCTSAGRSSTWHIIRLLLQAPTYVASPRCRHREDASSDCRAPRSSAAHGSRVAGRASQKSKRTADLVIIRVHPISFALVALLGGKRVRVAPGSSQDDDAFVAVTPHKLQLSLAQVAHVLEELCLVVVELPGGGATRSRRWPTAGRTRTGGRTDGRAARLALPA